MKNKTTQDLILEEIDWGWEDTMLEQEREWKKTLLPLSPLQLLEAYSDIIPALPTILAECEESKRALERQVMRELQKARFKNDPKEHFRTVMSLSVGIGTDIAKAEKHIQFLKNLINFSGLKNRTFRQSYICGEKNKQLAIQVPIETFIGINVRSSGKNKTCLCPLHSERTASFTIFPNNRWYCFGCNEGGDSISLAMRLYNLKFVEAIIFLTNNSSKIYAK